MSAHRTAWHFLFVILLRKRGPRWLEVREEVPLSEEPLRLDYLFLRKVAHGDDDDPGQSLRGLWPRLPENTIAELKTLGRPYRSRGLDRLWSYLHLYFADAGRAVARASDLSGVLIVPSLTPTLFADVLAAGLRWIDLGDGYWELSGGLFRMYVAEIDTVVDREDDDLLRLFSHAQERTLEARRFWAEQVGTKEAMMAVEEMEDYDVVIQKLVELLPPEKRLAGLAPEQRLAGLAPEQRLAGLAPEQRLAGLAPEQFLLTMPDEVLRALSADFIEHLPEPVRSAIRDRLGR